MPSLEYQDVVDNSVYVEFQLSKPIDGLAAYLLVWTTTPWTLPANLAIAVHAKMDYSLVRYQRAGQERVALVATDLRDRVFAKAGVPFTVVRTGIFWISLAKISSIAIRSSNEPAGSSWPNM